MLRKYIASPFKTAALLAVLAAALVYGGYRFYRHQVQQGLTYTIGIFYNSVNLLPEDVAVIKFLVGKKVEEINQEGGIGGRRLAVRYLDDKGSRQIALQKVKETLPDENLIGYLGSWGSSRVQAVAALVGKSGVPYIGGYSVTSIAAPYPNMFSYEIDVNQVALVMHKLLQDRSENTAFIGNTSDIYSEALFKALKQQQSQEPVYKIALEKWYPDEHIFKAPELEQLLDSLQQHAGMLVLSTNPAHTNTLLKALAKRNSRLPVFTAFSDIPEIDTAIPGFTQLELFDVSVFGIPSALNMRCQELEARYKNQFTESSRLQFQLGLGGLHADAIGLLKEAYLTEQTNRNLSVRQKINRGLAEYIGGKRVYKGWFSDWYFSPERVLVNEVLLGWKPPGLAYPVLAPLQHLRSDTGLQQAPVLYTHLDLIELDQIKEEDGTFNARFFLEVSAATPFTPNQIDFVNAVRNKVDHLPLLAIKTLQVATTPGKDGLYHYLYRVSGRFLFQPDLRQYPFDQQRFPITMQTNSALQPFLMQPARQQLSDTDFSSPGWRFKNYFVGFDQDIIFTANPILKQQRHIPAYKFSYTYMLKRTKVDFFLKLLIPLLSLLLVAYFSSFIPIREFVSVTAIQVTALLSVIALYFSVYKPAMAFATISDKIFIFAYVMITTLIGTSILEYWLYRRRRSRRRISQVVSFYERVLFPIIVAGFTLFLIF